MGDEGKIGGYVGLALLKKKRSKNLATSGIVNAVSEARLG